MKSKTAIEKALRDCKSGYEDCLKAEDDISANTYLGWVEALEYVLEIKNK